MKLHRAFKTFKSHKQSMSGTRYFADRLFYPSHLSEQSAMLPSEKSSEPVRSGGAMGVMRPLADVSKRVTWDINASRRVDTTFATAIRIKLHPRSSRIPHKKHDGVPPGKQHEQ